MKIVFHGRNARSFRPGFEALLEGAHELMEIGGAISEPGERDHYVSAEVIIGFDLSPAQPKPERLRLYHVPGAGYDRIDPALLPPGAALCNCFGHETAIAEYVMAALLARHVPLEDADRRLRRGDWRWWAGSTTSLRTELSGGTIGLLGFGRIGKAVAARAKAFGMRVHAANRSPVAADQADRAFALSELRAFMASADVVVCSLPLSAETQGLVDAAALAAMRPDAVIVNVGRGPVIEEAALYHALRDRRIGGAIIDTWYVYPGPDRQDPHPAGLPFHELDNVVMTPHMSGWTHGTIRRRQQAMAENIRRLEQGSALIDRVA